MKRYDKVLRISLLILKIARNLKKYNYCAYFKRFTFSMADSLQFCNNCILLYGKKKRYLYVRKEVGCGLQVKTLC